MIGGCPEEVTVAVDVELTAGDCEVGVEGGRVVLAG